MATSAAMAGKAPKTSSPQAISLFMRFYFLRLESHEYSSVCYPGYHRLPGVPARVCDMKVRRFTYRPANREDPGVRRTREQSRDRKGALAERVAGNRSLTVATRIGASRSSTSVSRTLPARYYAIVSRHTPALTEECKRT